MAIQGLEETPPVPPWEEEVGPTGPIIDPIGDPDPGPGGSGGGGSGGGSSPTYPTPGTPGSLCLNKDTDGNGMIDRTDARLFSRYYGFSCTSSNTTEGCGSFDDNGDGVLTLVDFYEFSKEFEKNCN